MKHLQGAADKTASDTAHAQATAYAQATHLSVNCVADLDTCAPTQDALHPPQHAGSSGVHKAVHGSDDFDEFHGKAGAPSEVLVALLTALPFAVAAFSTVGNAWHSKRTGSSLTLPDFSQAIRNRPISLQPNLLAAQLTALPGCFSHAALCMAPTASSASVQPSVDGTLWCRWCCQRWRCARSQPLWGLTPGSHLQPSW